MALTTEELLRVRYKVISDYPQPGKDEEHKLIKGDTLLHMKVNGVLTYRRVGRCGYMSVGVPCVADPENYPAIFRPLHWAEDRKEDELPEYVRHYNGEVYKHKYKTENGVIYYNQDLNGFPIGWLPMSDDFLDYLPATEAEYLAAKK